MGIYYSLSVGYGFEVDPNLLNEHDYWEDTSILPEGVTLMTTGFDSDTVCYIIAQETQVHDEARDMPATRSYDLEELQKYDELLEPLKAEYGLRFTDPNQLHVGISAG